MAKPSPFRDLRDLRAAQAPRTGPGPAFVAEDEVALREAAAYARGHEDGETAALAQRAARLADALQAIAENWSGLAAEVAHMLRRQESEAAALAIAAARAIAGDLMAERPFHLVEAALREVMADAAPGTCVTLALSPDLAGAAHERLAPVLAAGHGLAAEISADPALSGGDFRVTAGPAGAERREDDIVQALREAARAVLAARQPDTERETRR
jgi:flagellar assembly protein FliH